MNSGLCFFAYRPWAGTAGSPVWDCLILLDIAKLLSNVILQIYLVRSWVWEYMLFINVVNKIGSILFIFGNPMGITHCLMAVFIWIFLITSESKPFSLKCFFFLFRLLSHISHTYFSLIKKVLCISYFYMLSVYKFCFHFGAYILFYLEHFYCEKILTLM